MMNRSENSNTSVRVAVIGTLCLMYALFFRVLAWRYPDVAREGHAERTRGAISHALRHLGDAGLPAAQQVLRQRHPPSQQIIHRRGTHRSTNRSKKVERESPAAFASSATIQL